MMMIISHLSCSGVVEMYIQATPTNQPRPPIIARGVLQTSDSVPGDSGDCDHVERQATTGRVVGKRCPQVGLDTAHIVSR